MDNILYPVSCFSVRRHWSRKLGPTFVHEANMLSLFGVRANKNIAVHELMHFFEHCATPYGAFRDELHKQSLDLVSHFLREHSGPILTPVYEWAKRYLSDPTSCPGLDDSTAFADLIESAVKPWSRLAHLGETLEGENVAAVHEATIARVTLALAEMEATCVLLPQMSPSEEKPCPTMVCEGTDGKAIPIGAILVSECIAQIQEGSNKVIGQNIPPQYYALLLLGMDFHSRTERDFRSRQDRHLEMTLLALADLALFTPIGRTYSRLRPNNATWQSIHPGWRFFHALELVAKKDWWIASLFEAENLGNRICDALEWVRARTFLDLGSQIDGPAHARHRMACEIRLADFMAFYRRDRIFEPGTPVAEFLSDHMPIVYYPGMGTVFNVPPSDGKNATALRQLRDCFIALRCRQVMYERATTNVLPSECRFDLYFENIVHEQDFAMLIAQKYPWLETSRFHRL